MPRKTKDSKETLEPVENKKKATKKTTEKKVSTKTKNTSKKEAPKKASTKSAKEKVDKKAKADLKTKKASTSKSKEEKKSTKKTTTKKVADKEKVVKKAKADLKTKKASTSKAKETEKKSTSTVKKATKKNNSKSKVEVLEYYDLPYRYNQTIVKILAQTPTTLFVYWDISDKDKENYIKQYGEYFFNNTKPVLIINNVTKKYSYEVDINDFANSWYLHIEDSMCEYKIELGRRPINNYVSIPNNYLYISASNNIEAPNDHILFEKLSNIIYFRNVKTNTDIAKTNLYYLEKLKNTYSIKDFYKEMYKDEDFDFDKFMLKNPSSSSSTFK